MKFQFSDFYWMFTLIPLGLCIVAFSLLYKQATKKENSGRHWYDRNTFWLGWIITTSIFVVVSFLFMLIAVTGINAYDRGQDEALAADAYFNPKIEEIFYSNYMNNKIGYIAKSGRYCYAKLAKDVSGYNVIVRKSIKCKVYPEYLPKVEAK